MSGPSPEALAAIEHLDFFAQAWAKDVMLRIARVRDLRTQHHVDTRNADRLEDWSPTEQDLRDRFGTLWTEQHLLVVAAMQFMRWANLWACEFVGQPLEDLLPELRHLRNALEHASEAATSASGRLVPKTKKDRALHELGSILVGMDGSDLLFGHLDLDELERVVSRLSVSVFPDEPDD